MFEMASDNRIALKLFTPPRSSVLYLNNGTLADSQKAMEHDNYIRIYQTEYSA